MSDQVIMEWMDNLVSEVVKAQLAPEVSRDLQALDQRVTEVRITSPAEHLCLLVILITSSTSSSVAEGSRVWFMQVLLVIRGFLGLWDLSD